MLKDGVILRVFTRVYDSAQSDNTRCLVASAVASKDSLIFGWMVGPQPNEILLGLYS